MLKCLRLWSVFFLFIPLQYAEAFECSIDDFDKTEPHAIASSTSDLIAKFKWMSDVEIENDLSWRCDCIVNKDDKGWSGTWNKAAIVVPVAFPLPAGKEICRSTFLGQHLNDPDPDAPIIYGATNEVQQAAIYVRKEPEEAAFLPNKWGSVLRTSYLTKEGKSALASVSVNLVRDEKGVYQFSVNPSPGIIATLAGVDRIFSSSQVTSLIMKQGAQISDLQNWQEAGMIENEPLDKDSALIVSQPFQAAFATDVVAKTRPQQLMLNLYNQNRQLITTTYVDLNSIE